MILFYSWLAITVLIITVGLVVWYQWQSTAPANTDDEEWIDEDDERREPNWRRV